MTTLRGVGQYLEYLQQAGLTDVPVAPPLRENPSQPAVAKGAPTEENPMPQRKDVPSNSASKSASGSAREQLAVLQSEVAGCLRCSELAATRTQTVFGVGNPNARLLFFGEAPGADEDRLGEPFVGRAGKLLDKIIAACTLDRSDVYILNTLKCRPPGNRNPHDEEKANCRGYWEQQLNIIQPEFIVCLGAVSAQYLLNTTETIGKLRGTFHTYKNSRVMATYHPAYLLRNPSAKVQVWDDMQMLMKEMGIELPQKS